MKWYLMVLHKYADFTGRARRSEYWYFILFNLIAYYILAAVGFLLFKSAILGTIYYLFTIIPSFAVSIRRMHDVNKSGWYILIPFYNLILYFTEGTIGPNKYGNDPKREDIYEDIDRLGSTLLK